MNKVEREFKKYGKLRGGTLLLRSEDAVRMVQACRRINLPVLGVDGFRLDDQFTQPIMEHSVDLSKTCGSSMDCWEAAEKFLTERISAGLFFEVVAE